MLLVWAIPKVKLKSVADTTQLMIIKAVYLEQ